LMESRILLGLSILSLILSVHSDTTYVPMCGNNLICNYTLTANTIYNFMYNDGNRKLNITVLAQTGGTTSFIVTDYTNSPTNYPRGAQNAPVNWTNLSYPFETAYSWSTSLLSPTNQFTVTGAFVTSSRSNTDIPQHHSYVWTGTTTSAKKNTSTNFVEEKRQGWGVTMEATCEQSSGLPVCQFGAGTVYTGQISNGGLLYPHSCGVSGGNCWTKKRQNPRLKYYVYPIQMDANSIVGRIGVTPPKALIFA